MRLYLSSYRLGAHSEELRRLAGRGRIRTALVPNALDGARVGDRSAGLDRDVDELQALGLGVELADVRREEVVARLPGYDLIWTRGGNVFSLRKALAARGADHVLVDLLRADALVYGGYSAGCAVLAPDLGELAVVDDLTAVAQPIVSGLAVLDRPFVPHVRSPGHPETEACDALSSLYTARGQDHWALRDGEVLVVDGAATTLLGI